MCDRRRIERHESREGAAAVCRSRFVSFTSLNSECFPAWTQGKVRAAVSSQPWHPCRTEREIKPASTHATGVEADSFHGRSAARAAAYGEQPAATAPRRESGRVRLWARDVQRHWSAVPRTQRLRCECDRPLQTSSCV